MANKEIKFPYKKFIRTIVVLFILLSLSRIYKYYCFPYITFGQAENRYNQRYKYTTDSVIIDDEYMIIKGNYKLYKKKKYFQIINNPYNIGNAKIYIDYNWDYIYAGDFFLGTKEIEFYLPNYKKKIEYNFTIMISSIEADYWFCDPKYGGMWFVLKPTNTWDTLELSFHFSSNVNERVKLRCK